MMNVLSRRACVAVLAMIAAGATSGASAQDTSRVIQNSNVVVRAELATSLPGTQVQGETGLGAGDANRPREPQDGLFTDIVRVEDGTRRFIATTLGGNVHVLNENGQNLTSVANPLLTAAQTGNTATFNQRYGLNSFALHPDFATPDTFGYGKAYGVVSQDVPSNVSSVPAPTFTPFDSNGTAPGGGFSHDSVLFEYDLSSIVGDDSQNSIANLAAPRELLRVRQPAGSHNGFDLAFRSDGQLYYSVGDGTANRFQDDGGLRLQEAQDLDSVYGKLLRLNPDPTAFTTENGLGQVSANGQYSIADDNPFVGDTARSGADALPEVYANGFRSPFRISINPDNEDEVFLGDVGAGGREEVNRVIAGGNYGWGIREGSIALNQSEINVVTDGSTNLIGPEFEYARTNVPNGAANGLEAGGVAVIGGFVYEGGLFEGLTGQYLGAEIGNFQGTGNLSRVFFGDPDDDVFNPSRELSAFAISPDGDAFDNVNLGDRGLPNIITGLVEGFNGEVFVIGLAGTTVPGVDESGQNGDLLPGELVIARLLPDELPGDANTDGAINAADFTVLRDSLAVANDEDFERFRANFGLAFFNNSGGGSTAATAVPEPASLLSALAFILGCSVRRRRVA